MGLDSFQSDESSNEPEQPTDPDNPSTVHLYMVEGGLESGRGAGRNHEAEGYELTKEGGAVHDALTFKGSGRKYEWSLSDSLSHIVASIGPIVDNFPAPSTAQYVGLLTAVLDSAAEVITDDNHQDYLELFEPSGSDLAEYVESGEVEDLDVLRESLAVMAEEESEDTEQPAPADD